MWRILGFYFLPILQYLQALTEAGSGLDGTSPAALYSISFHIRILCHGLFSLRWQAELRDGVGGEHHLAFQSTVITGMVKPTQRTLWH